MKEERVDGIIGRLDRADPRVTVVGAGIAGLLIADALDLAGFEVRLVDKADRAGGLIATRQTPFGLAESAAHSLLVGPEARALFDRFGVRLQPLHADSRARFVLRRGRMRRMPLGPLELMGAFLRAYFVTSRASEGQTLAQWTDRHLGKAAREYLLAPFVRGVYGADPEELELAAAFPRLALPRGHSLLSYQLHRLRKGERRARLRMMAPEQGMGAVVDVLAQSLRKRLGARLELGREVRELPLEGNVVLSVPAAEAGRLLEREAPLLAKALAGIHYTPLVSVTAFVETASLERRPRGVGVLIPRAERSRKILGVLFNSSSFPGRAREGVESFTVMLGGPQSVLDDAETRVLVTDELCALFGRRTNVLHLELHRWPRAIPRYDHALSEALESARENLKPGRVLFGNYTGQVSIRGMIESIQNIRSL